MIFCVEAEAIHRLLSIAELQQVTGALNPKTLNPKPSKP